MSREDLKYEYDPKGPDYIIDELGNQTILLRNVRWKEENDFKLDLRKYVYSDQGERPLRGIAFLTEEGPGELIKALLELGYGDDDEIAEVIASRRPGIVKAFRKIPNDEVV